MWPGLCAVNTTSPSPSSTPLALERIGFGDVHPALLELAAFGTENRLDGETLGADRRAGREEQRRVAAVELTALPTGKSTSPGAHSTFGVSPPMRERLLNFQTVCSCAEESLAEIAKKRKSAAISMLHLLIGPCTLAWPGSRR